MEYTYELIAKSYIMHYCRDYVAKMCGEDEQYYLDENELYIKPIEALDDLNRFIDFEFTVKSDVKSRLVVGFYDVMFGDITAHIADTCELRR